MSLINKKVSDFKVQAYQDGSFKEVTLEDVKGHWSVFVYSSALSVLLFIKLLFVKF